MKASEIISEVGIKSGLKKIAGGNVLGGAAQTLGGLASAALAPLHWYGGGKLGTAPALTKRQKAEQTATQAKKAEQQRLRDIPIDYTEKINDLLTRQGISPYKSITNRDPNYNVASQILQNFILTSELARGDGKFDYRTEQAITRRLVDELSQIPIPTTINETSIKNYINDIVNKRVPIIQSAYLQYVSRSQQQPQQQPQPQPPQPVDVSGAQVIRPTTNDPNTYVRFNNFVYILGPNSGGQWVSQRGLPINAQYNDAFNQLL
jgi:hypothetical protein